MQFTIGDVTAGWLEFNVGVRQGCMISPRLFNICQEELIVRLKKSRKEVKIGERLGCMAYADDVV